MRTKVVLTLLLLSPVLGEMLSGSSPPLEFFQPFTLFLLISLYGCGAVLIRELKVRWGLQWQLILLGIAYGIIEEGLMIQSFFNHNHEDLGKLSRYGAFLGVQWPWTIMLIGFHLIVSISIPIIIVDLLWPKAKNMPALTRGTFVFFFFFFSLAVVMGMILIMLTQIGQPDPYYANPVLILLSLIIPLFLIWISYLSRGKRIVIKKFLLLPPVILGALAFVFQFINLFLPNVMAEQNAKGLVTIFIQVLVILIFSLLAVSQIFNRLITVNHATAMVMGTMFAYILLAPVFEFELGMRGTFVVGLFSTVLLVLWRRRALSYKQKVS